MKVTDLQYSLEKRLVKKLDLIITRCTQNSPKKDAALICEGAEGEGKTNSSLAIAYYFKHHTKREIHMFFRVQALIDYAQSTENKIIIWDEPALDSLSTQWYKQVNTHLMQLLMMVRKKRHIFIFNFTKFHKFSEYIVVDRSLGLIHMYSRKERIPGRFVYIKRRDLQKLYLGYKFKKVRLYKELTSFRGSFGEVLEKHFDKMGVTVEGVKNATLKDYEGQKDKAIMSIGKNTSSKQDKTTVELKELRTKIGKFKCPIKTRAELAERFGITVRTLQRWASSGTPPENGRDTTTPFINKGIKSSEDVSGNAKDMGVIAK